MRRHIALVLGVVMIGIGAWLALRPLLAPGHPVSSSRGLDLAFALFFVLRGTMNVRSARRRPRTPAMPELPAAPATPPAP